MIKKILITIGIVLMGISIPTVMAEDDKQALEAAQAAFSEATKAAQAATEESKAATAAFRDIEQKMKDGRIEEDSALLDQKAKEHKEKRDIAQKLAEEAEELNKIANDIQKAIEEKIRQRDEFQAPIIPKPPTLPGIVPTGEKDQRTQLTQSVLPKIAVNMVGTVSIFALLFLIISGVRFATAYGNEENIEKAKKQATIAVVGLLIALLAYTIVRIIVNFRIP
jgi:flagellar motor protein MotB